MDEIDICTILANALDNARDACLTNKSDRWIELSCILHDNGNFSIDIRNACDTPVEFGKRRHAGLPQGCGTRSSRLKASTRLLQKYNGLLRCTCENRVFRLSAALFQPDNVPTMRFSGMKRTVANTALALLLLLCFINIFPDTVQALESVPFVGNVLRLADFRTYCSSFTWGSSSLEVSFLQIAWKESASALLSGVPGNKEDTATSAPGNTLIPPASPAPDSSENMSSDTENTETTPPANTDSTNSETKPTVPPSEPTVPEAPQPTGPVVRGYNRDGPAAGQFSGDFQRN